MGDGGVGSGSVDSGCHQLPENIWFVCLPSDLNGPSVEKSAFGWVLCGFCGCGGSVWVMGEWAVGD